MRARRIVNGLRVSLSLPEPTAQSDESCKEPVRPQHVHKRADRAAATGRQKFTTAVMTGQSTLGNAQLNLKFSRALIV